MSNVCVYIETDEGRIRKSSLEAVCYASHIAETSGAQVTGIILGPFTQNKEDLAILGMGRLIIYSAEIFSQNDHDVLSSVLSEIFIREKAGFLILGRSSMSDSLAAKISIRTESALVTNVSELPSTLRPLTVKRSILGGKAFERVQTEMEKCIITIEKNACGIRENPGKITVEEFKEYPGTVADIKSKVVSREKKSGGILLNEAEIVVSAGRGMKGPEHWGIIEDLASALGASTACSKPVSDAGWRPHSEHVGQTGLKIAPNLYIAVGISGAIQHLAGVSSSRVIVVINKDPEAPFFQAADYGIIGDAFEIVPVLTEEIKKLNK